MKYNIRGDKIVATKAIKDYVQDKLGRLDKYFKESDEYTANVLIRVKGHKQTIEVTVPTNKFILRSEVTDEDLYAAIDIVCDKLERQIRKNKTRLKKKSVLDSVMTQTTFSLTHKSTRYGLISSKVLYMIIM